MFDLKQPCHNCPFRREGGIRLRPGRSMEIVNGGFFPCHLTTTHDEDGEGDTFIQTGKEQYCAGKLLLHLKTETSDQMMRIGLRTGWDPEQMQDADAVFDSLDEMEALQRKVVKSDAIERGQRVRKARPRRRPATRRRAAHVRARAARRQR